MSGFNANTRSISIRQGESATFFFTMTRSEDGSPIDITSEKFVFICKRSPRSPELLRLVSGEPRVDPVGSNPYDATLPPTASEIGVVDGPAGRWMLSLSAVATRGLPAGDLQYEIDKIQGDGSVRTILHGDFVVAAELG